jgi:hypothetical protein
MASTGIKTARPFREWIPHRTRRLHRSVTVLPHLEAEFFGMLELLSRSRLDEHSARVWQLSLVEAVAGIRSELGRGFRALSEVRRGLDRSGLSDDEIGRRLGQRLDRLPGTEDLVNQLRNAGGHSLTLRRLSLELLRRYEAYTECLRLLRRADPNDPSAFGRLPGDIIDHLPPSRPGTPDTQYSFICAAGLIGLLVTGAIVVAVIVAVEDEIDEDPPQDDDEGEPDGGDPDAGICEGELEPDAGICTPQ